MSFHILFALLFIAASCKSEVKPTQPLQDDMGIEVKNELDNPTDAREVITPTPEEKPAKEVIQPEKKPETEKVKSTSKESKKTKKPRVDKGIEIEMGIEDSKPKVEVTEPKKDVKNNPVETVKENPVKEMKEAIKERPAKPEKAEAFVGFPSHSIFDGLLKAHVSASGVVDYAGLKSKEAELDKYLKNLENHGPETTWNRDQELAFWINAYNAYTIKLILNNYPVASITDLHGGKPWDVKWINLNGKTLSLNNIENDIIRPKYNEPRIHFAVNCAAKSCPPILNAAYKAKSLESQLESQTKKFVNNSKFNTLGKNAIEVSKIFDWYGVDFGSVASFFVRYADTTVKPSAKVSFKEYDWSLNGK